MQRGVDRCSRAHLAVDLRGGWRRRVSTRGRCSPRSGLARAACRGGRRAPGGARGPRSAREQIRVRVRGGGWFPPLPQRAPSKQKPRQETSKRASGAPVPVPPGAYLTGQGVACVTFRPGPGPGPHFPAQDTAAAVPGERGWVPEPGAERPPLPRLPPGRTAFRGPSVIRLSAAAVVWEQGFSALPGALGDLPPAPRSQGSPHHRPAQGFGFRRGTCHPSWSRLPAGSTSQRLRPTSGQPTRFIQGGSRAPPSLSTSLVSPRCGHVRRGDSARFLRTQGGAAQGVGRHRPRVCVPSSFLAPVNVRCPQRRELRDPGGTLGKTGG